MWCEVEKQLKHWPEGSAGTKRQGCAALSRLRQVLFDSTFCHPCSTDITGAALHEIVVVMLRGAGGSDIPSATDGAGGCLVSRMSRKETSRFFIGTWLSSLHCSCFGRPWETKGGAWRDKVEVGTDAGVRAAVVGGEQGVGEGERWSHPKPMILELLES
jgi:hypothetical protein